jgi:phosphoribosylformylglycinamidine synthase
VGTSVKRAVEDCLGGAPRAGEVYTATLYLFWGLERAEVERVASVLHNPLIERARVERWPHAADLTPPRAGSGETPGVAVVALASLDDEGLARLSKRGMLALSVPELRAIQDHFRGLGRDPSDAELECLAQTWSEHCKHKIFASAIEYTGPEGQTRLIRRGLFREYIRGLTEALGELRRAQGVDPEHAPFLVSVFHDNAGVVRFTEEDHLVYKVETHNSPSALDPYGGAMTGIVGVNRDSLATGVGADLLANVWGYCFGPPEHDAALPPGLMHPRRIREGVHAGVIDGGNQSGIPYARGFEIFDARYVGKPLVYCGTVAVMPAQAAGWPTHQKRIASGDAIVMLGGRIGKDGIHGATFSSAQLDEDSPVQAVQIGDPITQKMMADLLTEARERGLYSGITDNGAGGLSSSVGELATATGGARIDLANAPLKYPGLAPWEILISEAQERMTLVVPQASLEGFLALARRREVEASVLGEFTETGRFEVVHGATTVVDLSLEFLHEGVPLPVLEARWDPPARPRTDPDELAEALADERISGAVLELLARPNLRAADELYRAYDHEVKGLSVIKPLVGAWGDVPATATVMCVRHGRREGVVLAEGVHPHYSDIDTHAMATAVVDEAVRRVLCAGARLDRLSALDNFCWPDPIVSETTPDGRHKLAQLVRCCEGLREACEVYGAPLISGKDSMKNDALLGGVKISIPPTLLVSVMAQMQDVRKAIGLAPLRAGDDVYVLGDTRDELAGGEFARLRGLCFGDDVPRTDVMAAISRYRAFVAVRDAGHVRSAHIVGRGGLALALCHMVMASELGLDVEITDIAGEVGVFELDKLGGTSDAVLGRAGEAGLGVARALFSESTGRIVFTARAAARTVLKDTLGGHGIVRVGVVAPPRAVRGAGGEQTRGWLRITRRHQIYVDLTSPRLRTFYANEGQDSDASGRGGAHG